MVVFYAGTTGYNLTFDARYVWMRQKRIQGSHFAHLKQASAGNQFVLDRRIEPCMSEVFAWDKIPLAHQMMWKNQHKPGNMAVLVNTPRPGLRTLEDVVEAGGGGRVEGCLGLHALAARLPDRIVELAAVDEARGGPIEKDERDHRGGEARIGRHV